MQRCAEVEKEVSPFGMPNCGKRFFYFLGGMEETDSKVSAELLALTYGAFISQIVKDYEDVVEINKQIEQLGYKISISLTDRYNIGIRLVEEYLSKTRTRGLKSFKTTCENIATKAFSMYMGIKAVVNSWDEDEQSCFIRTSSMLPIYYRVLGKSSNSFCRTP